MPLRVMSGRAVHEREEKLFPRCGRFVCHERQRGLGRGRQVRFQDASHSRAGNQKGRQPFCLLQQGQAVSLEEGSGIQRRKRRERHTHIDVRTEDQSDELSGAESEASFDDGPLGLLNGSHFFKTDDSRKESNRFSRFLVPVLV